MNWHKRSEKWLVQITHGGKKHHVGLFADAADGARAYNLMTLRLHESTAFLNDVGGDDPVAAVIRAKTVGHNIDARGRPTRRFASISTFDALVDLPEMRKWLACDGDARMAERLAIILERARDNKEDAAA